MKAAWLEKVKKVDNEGKEQGEWRLGGVNRMHG